MARLPIMPVFTDALVIFDNLRSQARVVAGARVEPNSSDAQLDTASGAPGVQHCVPSAFLPLHPNAHHPSLALHLEEKFLIDDDRDRLAP